MMILGELVWLGVTVLVYLVGIGLALDAIMTSRTAQGSTAWVVGLVAFPFLAVPLYLLFGERCFKGYVAARRHHDQGMEEFARLASERYHAQYDLPPSRAALKVFETIAGLRFTRNELPELLVDGKMTFDAITAAIAAAQRYVLVQFYILRDDELGRRMQQLLISKAKEGLRVYVMVDAIGSSKLGKRYVSELQVAGVHFTYFRSTKRTKTYKGRLQVNFRNHRKVVVVDGIKAFVGGLNCGDDYLSRDPKIGNWRDTHVEVEGYAALEAQVSFAEDWHWSTDAVPAVEWRLERRTGQVPVLMIPTGPTDRVEGCTLFFTHAINLAQKRLWIATPYFVPDEQVMAALQLAVMRGVDVRLLMTGQSDNAFTKLASYSFVPDLLRAGVKGYYYGNGFMHQKVMLIDDDLATVGSANFDNRSFRLNFEITAMILDERFNARVEAMLLEDLRHASVAQLADLEGRSFWFRLGAGTARLCAPLL